MEENEVVKIVRDFISRGFPKKCTCCGKKYISLTDYLRNTTHLGKPLSYDAQNENWRPKKPIGTLSMANCSCGSTLSISSKGMNIITFWKLMFWARKETKARGINIEDLLEDLRNKVDKSVFGNDSNQTEN